MEPVMTRHQCFIRAGATVLPLLLLGACATVSPRLDANFGLSVTEAVDLQLIDPLALFDANPVFGLDGRAAVSAVRHYESTFTTPQAPTSVFAIGPTLGTGLGAAAAVPSNP
jgi:hypothetical protein